MLVLDLKDVFSGRLKALAVYRNCFSPIKLRLISKKKQSSRDEIAVPVIRLKSYKGQIKAIWLVFCFFVSFFFSEYASANILDSFFGGVSAQSDIQNVIVPINLQNMELLEPILNKDKIVSKNSGVATIIEGSALVAESGIEGTIMEVEEKENMGRISIYEVRPGDTLTEIAEMFDVSVNTIRWANNLNKAIVPGQKLIILPISGLQYIVKKGDTLSSIAKKYKADEFEIAVYNDMNSETALIEGQKILIPNADIQEENSNQKRAISSSSYISPSLPKYAGYYIHPVPSSFRTQKIHPFNAVDFGAPIGTPIYASAGGTVIVARTGGWNAGYGNYLVISHSNGTQTLYAHTNSLAVAEGENVYQGQIIGYVGSTGNSTGPHLHFEIRGAYNPFGY